MVCILQIIFNIVFFTPFCYLKLLHWLQIMNGDGDHYHFLINSEISLCVFVHLSALGLIKPPLDGDTQQWWSNSVLWRNKAWDWFILVTRKNSTFRLN